MRIVRLVVYALCVAVLSGYPDYDWRDTVAKLVSAAAGYSPPGANLSAPTVYQPQGVPAPPPTPSAPPTPGALGHYQTPDYASLISADPGLISTTSQVNAAESTLGRSRADAVRRALVQFGVVPAGWQSGYGDVDEPTLAAASQNPFSIMRQLGETRARGSADLAAALGARGILSSGALTGGEQLLQRQFEGSQYDATSKLLAALGGYEGDYSSGFGNLERQKQQAYTDASGRVAMMNPAQWIADQTPAAVAPPESPYTAPPAYTEPSPYTAPPDTSIPSLPTWSGETALPPFDLSKTTLPPYTIPYDTSIPSLPTWSGETALPQFNPNLTFPANNIEDLGIYTGQPLDDQLLAELARPATRKR